MSSIIGLAGAHRTGKTTLAQAYAGKRSAHFHQMDTAKLMAKHGYDSSNQTMDFKDKLRAQELLLHEYYDSLTELRMSEHKLIITDRTPLDLATYLLIRVGPEESEEYSAEIIKYIRHCIAMANTFYTGITVTQPGIPLISDSKSAAASMAYIEHYNSIILGLTHHDLNQSPIQILSRLDIDLGTRVRKMGEFHGI